MTAIAKSRIKSDLSRLDLRTETDLPDLFHLMMAASAGSVVAAGKEGGPEQARARLVCMLELLQRGAAAKDYAVCQG